MTKNFLKGNTHPRRHCSPRVIIYKEGEIKPYFVPSNLLYAMWFQFYKVFIGEMKIRRCAYCKEWMDITDSRKVWWTKKERGL